MLELNLNATYIKEKQQEKEKTIFSYQNKNFSRYFNLLTLFNHILMSFARENKLYDA